MNIQRITIQFNEILKKLMQTMVKCGLLGCNEIGDSLNPDSSSWHRKGKRG